jgi:hypothetical protein
VWPAILVALVWSYGAMSWRAVTGRRTSGLLVLTAIVLTGRTAIALAAQSTFFYFLQPIITDGAVAATFLLSLATARPMVARLAGDFYPMDAELSLRPRIRRLFWHLTAMWAVICLAKAVMMFWALNSLSLDTFGRPDPNQDPPCERVSDTSVVQALHLMNAPNLHAKLSGETGRVASLASGEKSPPEIVDELLLHATKAVVRR